MPSYKLPFGLVLKKATILLLLLVNRLLLLRFVQFKVTIDTLQRIVKNRYEISSSIHDFDNRYF